MFCTDSKFYFEDENDLENGLYVLQNVPLPKGGAVLIRIEVLKTQGLMATFFPYQVKLHLSDLTDIYLRAFSEANNLLYISALQFPVAFADYLKSFCRREPHIAWLSGVRQPLSPLFRLTKHPWFTANVILRNVFEYLYHSPNS